MYKFFAEDPSGIHTYKEALEKALPDYGHTITIDDYMYGDTPKPVTFWIKSIGNKDVPVGLTGSSKNLDITYDGTLSDGKLAPEGVIKITVTPKKTLAAGSYNEQIYFRDSHVKSISFKFNVLSENVTIRLKESMNKPYGTIMTSADVMKNLEVTPKIENLDILGLTFSCNGFSEDADANKDYLISLTSTNSNYKVTLESSNNNKLTVTPVAPAGEETVNAEGILTGKSLSDSALTGIFHHPTHPDWTVEGTLTWDTDQSGTEKLTEGEHTFKWIFKPASSNYTEVKGETVLLVSGKTPTVISQTSSNTFIYGGTQRGMSFTTNRPTGQQGTIKVEYKRKNEEDSAYTTVKPVKAGEYDVRASIEENDTYAADSRVFDMTIEPRTIYANYLADSKVYDGTTTANVRASLSNTVGRDDITIMATGVFDDPNVGTRKNVSITCELGGKDAYNYVLYGNIHHTTADIKPATITTITPITPIIKEYGQTVSLTADQFAFTGMVAGEQGSVLDAEFFCAGTDATADVGEYPITVELHGGNYVLADNGVSGTGNAGKLTITKATPQLLTGTLNTSYGHAGNELSTVTVNGTFVNPHDHSIVVPGTFMWKDSSTKMVDQGGGRFTAEWTFVPDDTKNYNLPDSQKVEITLMAKNPIQFTAADKTVTYNGTPQGLSVEDGDIIITDEDTNIDKSQLDVTVEYRKHQDLTRKFSAIALAASWETWTEEAPTDAGIYDVQVTVHAGQYTNNPYNRSDNIMLSTLVIEKADPVFGPEDNSSIEVPEGTLLVGTELKTLPKSVSGEELPGTFAWEYADTPVTESGEMYQWVFSPEDMTNYNTVTGRTTVNLAVDTRTIKATVYNLPSELDYTDYALVDVKESGLKAGDTVTFYIDADCTNAESDTVTVTESSTLVVYLDGDALADNDGVIYARITSSKKHEADAISYTPEVGFTVDSNVNAYIGYDTELEAVLTYGNPISVSFKIAEDSSDLITLKQTGKDGLTSVITGNGMGHVHVLVEMTFAHPDTVNHPNDIITIIKTVHVTVNIHPGDLKVKVLPEAGAPAVSIPDVSQELLKKLLLTDEDKNLIEDGINIFVELIVRDADTTVTAGEKAAVNKCIDMQCPGYIVGQYLDISLLKVVGNEEAKKIDSTEQPVSLVISVPDDLRAAGRTFRIIRIHDDEASVLEDMDSDPDTITIQTDRFSIYAIAYRDPSGNLTVSNSVTGSGDQNKTFTFTVTLGDTSINGQYGGMNFKDGVAEFTLKHGETLTAEGLPLGLSYSVVENEENQNGYATTSTGASGTILEGETKAVFTNHMEAGQESTQTPTQITTEGNTTEGNTTGNNSVAASPKTGDSSMLMLCIMLLLLSVSCIFLLGSLKQRRNKNSR